MGLFNSSDGVVYKPAQDVDLSPTSSEFYLKAHVKGLLFSLSFFFPFFSSYQLYFLPFPTQFSVSRFWNCSYVRCSV